ncbi:hypothetical protein ACINWC487_0461 [Acinetobacter nosocomialis]|nr:hypothetical protein ACINWC487_0461 [Acinetobacter nosocomialis]
MSKKHKTYTTEFKAEAIKLIEANQGNVSETADNLAFQCKLFQIGIPKQRLEL